jgi:hypothetical protein
MIPPKKPKKQKEQPFEVPLFEVQFWIENGWKLDEEQNKMFRKGREAVNVQQFKTMQL